VKTTLPALLTALSTALAAAVPPWACASELTPAPRAAQEVARVVPGIEVGAPIDRQSAQAALALVAERRAAFEAEWAQRRIDCYRRFLVNPCLGDLRQDRVAAERQFEEVELAARQALRDDAAYERNRREAQRLALEQERAAAELEQREANRRAWEARQQAARDSAAQRALDDARQAESAAAQREGRERETGRPDPGSTQPRQSAPLRPRRPPS
jgi:colicin import membrane protein